jgi:hypothetical protein
VVITQDILEKTVRELGLRLAQAEIDRAMALSRLTIVMDALHEITMASEQNDGWPPEARARLQTLVVTLRD